MRGNSPTSTHHPLFRRALNVTGSLTAVSEVVQRMMSMIVASGSSRTVSECT